MSKTSVQPRIVAVLGAGNFGTTISQVLAENGHRVHLWNWQKDHKPLRQIERYHENKTYLPGVRLLKNIIPTYHIDMALYAADAIFLAVPSTAMEHTISFAARSMPEKTHIVNLSKGLHPTKHKPMSQVIQSHLRPSLRKHVVTLSGPAVAEQLVHHQTTFMNIASRSKRSRDAVKELIENDFVKLVPTKDMVGIEVAGSFKNVYAILIGVCDGMKLGLNTKAALLTLGVREIEDAIVMLGGKRRTACDLAGLGDLIGTAFSRYSRNRAFGELLGKGNTVTEAKKKMRQTVEGVSATDCLYRIAAKHKKTLPLAGLVYHILHGKGDPRKKVTRFLTLLRD